MEKGFEIKVLDKGFVRLIDWYGSDQRIIESARISYKSPSKGEEQDKKLLFYLYKNRHTSPFEQSAITFNIKLPLFVQGQMVRHRTQKLNQVSARYTEMLDEFYIPTTWRRQDKKNKQGSLSEQEWNPLMFQEEAKGIEEKYPNLHHKPINATRYVDAFCKISYVTYQNLLKSGVAREMARMILPQNLYTEIYSQWDLHNLMHFFRLRLDIHAQWEIRQYAVAMYKVFEDLYPWTAEAYDKFKWKLIE